MEGSNQYPGHPAEVPGEKHVSVPCANLPQAAIFSPSMLWFFSVPKISDHACPALFSSFGLKNKIRDGILLEFILALSWSAGKAGCG